MFFRRPDPEKIMQVLRSGTLDERTKAARALRNSRDARAVEALIAALKDDEAVRRGAVAVLPVSDMAEESLSELGVVAVPPLIGALQRNEEPKDWLVRLKAARCLGRIGDAQAVEGLVTALGDSQRLVREAAATSLARIGKPATDALQAAAEQQQGVVQLGACEALAAIGNPAALGPLSRALQGEDISVRKQAARALGRLRDPRAVAPLLTCLQDDDADLRAYAMQSLVAMESAQEPLVKLLASAEGRRAVDALRDAVKFGSLKREPRSRAVVAAALKRSFYQPGGQRPITFVELLVELGDDRGKRIMAAAQAGSQQTMEQMIAQL